MVLMEDAIKYLERGESAQNFNAARQIYLTFPADCSFTEDDVSNYFKYTFFNLKKMLCCFIVVNRLG